jgi:hypothetical protein
MPVLALASLACPSLTLLSLSTTNLPLLPGNSLSTSAAPISLFQQSLNTLVNMSSQNSAGPRLEGSVRISHDINHPVIPKVLTENMPTTPFLPSGASPRALHLSQADLGARSVAAVSLSQAELAALRAS